MTPDKPHQLSLIPNVEFDDTADVKIRSKVDVFYVTRFQKERWAEASEDYPRIDAKFLKASKYSETSVLHPLPRVGELDIALDTRQPRPLFPAGGLWRADPHGADRAPHRYRDG